MRQSIKIGRVGGIPIGIHWSVLFIVALLVWGLAVNVLPHGAHGYGRAAYWLTAVVIAVVFMASLLAHELSHSFVARHYGVRIRRITLWLLGGVSELEGDAPTPRADLLIALAGPLASLALGGAFALLAGASIVTGLPRLLNSALVWLAAVNVLLGVFNLLPGAPLDGGRVLRAILWRATGDRATAQRGASRAGIVLGVLLIAAGGVQALIRRNIGGLWLVLLGWFLIAAARAEGADAQTHTTLGEVRVADAMNAEPVCGYAGQSVDEFVNGVARHHRYRAFPVLDLNSRLVGVVSLADLARVPASARATMRLPDVALPADRLTVLEPGQRLAEPAAGIAASAQELMPVTTDGRLVGVLSSGDVTRTLELAALNTTPAPAAGRSA